MNNNQMNTNIPSVEEVENVRYKHKITFPFSFNN